MMEWSFDVLFYTVFGAIVCYFVYRLIRHGGFKSAMFWAHIDRTVGEVRGEKQGLVGVVLKVHVLDRQAPEKRVGLELVATSFASYQMTPVTLSASQAQQLASLLHEAVRTP
jgi:hypothetical protein